LNTVRHTPPELCHEAFNHKLIINFVTPAESSVTVAQLRYRVEITRGYGAPGSSGSFVALQLHSSALTEMLLAVKATLHVHLLKVHVRLNELSKYSSYLTENTLRLSFKDQPVNAV
jgi:hypothetical protein